MGRVATGYLTQPQVQQAAGVSRRTLRWMLDADLLAANTLTTTDVVIARLLATISGGPAATRYLTDEQRTWVQDRDRKVSAYVREAVASGTVDDGTRLVISPPGPDFEIHLVATRRDHRLLVRTHDSDFFSVRIGRWLAEARAATCPSAAQAVGSSVATSQRSVGVAA